MTELSKKSSNTGLDDLTSDYIELSRETSNISAVNMSTLSTVKRKASAKKGPSIKKS